MRPNRLAALALGFGLALGSALGAAALPLEAPGQPAASAAAAALAAAPASTDAAAENAASASAPLGLEEAKSLALARSAAVRQALLAVDEAVLAERLESYSFLPSLSVDAGGKYAYGSSASGAVAASAGVGIAQPLYDGGRSALRKAIDAAATGMARESVRSAVSSLEAEVESAYFGVLEAEAALEAAKSDLESSSLHLGLATAKYEASALSRPDLLEVESEAATAEAAFVKARREVSLSRAALASLTGLPSGTALAGVDAARYDQAARGLALASDEAVSAAASRLAAAAAESDPETASAALASGKAAASVKLAERAWLPGVSAGYSHTVPLGAGESLGLGSGSLSVSASLSLDFWTKKAGLESARLAAGKAAIGLEEAKRKAALGVESAAYDCAALARSLVASAKALEHAESRLEAVRELFALSAASSAELSDAEALAGSARKALVAARFGFISSLSGLGRLAGLEDEELLIAALRG
ncbi:MAG TPA: TolC family protein [Spirochaetia bacterium]|nr:TolC family protein [Spirochaetales bacterium]HRY71862.1 TolC family protein [Spirochaetia bacterium]